MAKSAGNGSAATSVSLATRLRIWWYFSCPRTWLYAVLGFHFGYYLSSGDLGWRLWLGCLILYGAVGTGSTNFINMIYDTAEDSINKPVRADYIRVVTKKQLMVATWVFYAISIALSLAYGSGVMVAFTLVSIFHSHQYSAPPLRFKAHWLTNNTFLSFGSCTIPFLAGWCVGVPPGEESYNIPWAPVFLNFVFILLSLIAKDVPDIEGDRFANLKTVVNPLLHTKDKRFNLSLYRMMAFVPAAICSFMVAAGFLPTRYCLFSGVSVVFLATVFDSDLGEPTSPGKCYETKDARSTHFVKMFTYTQLGDCLIYCLAVEPTAATVAFSAITAAAVVVWIFSVGLLYPGKESGVAAAPRQHGG
eukprot:TRINITY_DN5521_c0_g1_i1.p1 TRINITY_DN5521_c0_g1~~TRINITY_DN5521_c0_g1_i1.p1  ORF type:complete len:368 (-),score=102.42 TRINITY_DN5521_c0_g1_i1:197-1279(-)